MLTGWTQQRLSAHLLLGSDQAGLRCARKWVFYLLPQACLRHTRRRNGETRVTTLPIAHGRERYVSRPQQCRQLSVLLSSASDLAPSHADGSTSIAFAHC